MTSRTEAKMIVPEERATRNKMGRIDEQRTAAVSAPGDRGGKQRRRMDEKDVEKGFLPFSFFFFFCVA